MPIQARYLLSDPVMRIGIPTWHGTVSPVFDVARRLLVVDVEAGVEARRFEESLGETHVLGRATHVTRLGVTVLICGAVSWPLEQALASAGIEVVAHVCGNVEDVLAAHLSGRLAGGAFLMPGCRGCRYRRGRGRGGGRGLGRRGGAR